MAVIRSKSLAPSDVAILTGRGQVWPTGFATLRLEDHPLTLGRNIVRFRRELRLFDSAISRLVGEQQYAAYVPGLFTEQLFALANHRRCAQLSFIEEGTGSAALDNRRYGRRPSGLTIAANIAAWPRFPKHGTDCSAMIHAGFHVTPDAFSDWPPHQRHQLQFDPRGDSRPERCPNDSVMVVEMIPESQRASLGEYQRVVAESLGQLERRGLERLAVKFHPNNLAEVKRGIGEIVRQVAPGATFLPAEVVLEEWMGESGPLFLGTSSSVLHYAVLAGGRSATQCDLFSDRRVAEYFERVVPDSTRSGVERLQGGR